MVGGSGFPEELQTSATRPVLGSCQLITTVRSLPAATCSSSLDGISFFISPGWVNYWLPANYTQFIKKTNMTDSGCVVLLYPFCFTLIALSGVLTFRELKVWPE